MSAEHRDGDRIKQGVDLLDFLVYKRNVRCSGILLQTFCFP